MRERVALRRWLRPRFGLRTLYFLVAAAAILCGWLVSQYNTVKHRQAVLKSAWEHGAWYLAVPVKAEEGELERRSIPWSRRIFGDLPMRFVTLKAGAPRELVDSVRSAYPEADVSTEEESGPP
jgi:hypothetical protein